MRKELLRPDRSEFSAGDAFRFRHVLIRDAAYEALPKAERAALHERFADWLEAAAGDRLTEVEEILGFHLAEAARYRAELGEGGPGLRALEERAGLRLADAGRRALDTGDARIAVALLEQARVLMPAGAGELARVLLDLHGAYSSVGEKSSSLAALEAAGVAITTETSLVDRSRYRVVSAYFEFAGPDSSFAGMGRIGEELIAQGEEASDDRVISLGLRTAGEAVAWTGGMVEERRLLERAIELDRRGGRTAAVAVELATIANRLPMGPWPVAEAIPVAVATLAEVVGNPDAHATVLLGLGMLELLGGRAEAGRRRFAEAKRLADELGLVIPTGAADWPMCMGMAELVAGEPVRVVDVLRWSAAELERISDHGHLATVAPLLAQVLLTLGPGDPEVDRLIELGRSVASPDDFDAQARVGLASAVRQATQGHHDAALRHLAETRNLLADTDLLLLRYETEVTAVRLAVLRGDEPEASQARAVALQLATTKGSPVLRERVHAL